MPAIPIIAGGISAYSSYRQAKSAGKVAGAQQDLMNRQSALANEMSGFARNQYTAAQPALNMAMQHYMKLAGGNRAALNSELGPERAALNETYRGAERGLTSRMAAGPSRDRHIAELYRQRAGQLGLMPMNARSAAFGNLNQMGNTRLQAALSAYGGAGNALTGASNTGQNWGTAQANANQAWGSFTKGISDLGLGAYDWWKRSHA